MKTLSPLFLLLPLTACSVFSSYPQETAEARRAFEEGNFQRALSLLPENPGGPDELLYRLERGLIAHTAGEFSRGNQELLAASELIKGYEGRPTISLRSSLEGLASILLNDKTLPYDGEGFERVLLHAYLALNFYYLGKTDDAFVETRLAYETQRDEERRYSTSYAGQGAFGRYLSGILRETVGEPGEAYIDYKKVHELIPSCRTALQDLLRLAKRLGYEDDVRRWEKEIRPSGGSAQSSDSASGEIVFLFQCGLGPIKRPIEIPIRLKHGVTKFVAPEFVSRPNPIGSARLLIDGKPVGRTELLEDLESVGRKNLSDRIALVVAKAGARAAAKAVVTEKLHKKYDDWGSLVGSLFTVVTEQPDLRSWLTLPKNIQILRLPLGEGVHQFSVELLAPGGNLVGSRPLGSYRVRAGERMVLNLRSAGNSSFAGIVGGESIEPKKESP